MRILIVDDEIVSRSKMSTIMSHFGDCEAVDSGEMAIASFKKAWRDAQPFNLISLDIDMPDMDGFEVLSALREFEQVFEVEGSRH